MTGRGRPFIALLRRELQDHLRDGRALVGILITVVLCGLAGWVRTEDFRQAHHERDAFLQRWQPSVLEQMARDESIQVENTRAVSPLAVLSIGLEPILPFRFASTKEGLRLGESRGARTLVDALFGSLDLAFVVGLLLSLLALALTFDSICGERTSGTLAVLLSYPVRRSTLLAAKVAAAVTTLATSFLLGLTLVITVVSALGGGGLHAERWLLFLSGSLLYLVVFSTLGVAISAWVRRPPEAALVCVLAWVLLAFVAPRVIGIAVSQWFPPSRAVEQSLREEEAVSRLRVEFTQRMYAGYYALVGGDGDEDSREKAFEKVRKEATDELQRKRRDVLDRLRGETDREEARRDRVTAALAVVSPTALFNRMTAELAWTGMAQRDHTMREIRTYDDTIGRKLAESRQLYFSLTSRSGGAKALVIKGDMTPYLVPFQPTWLPLSAITGPVTASNLLLAGFAGLFFVVGYVGLVRLDVRPL